MILVIEDESYIKKWFVKAFQEQKIDFAVELNDALRLMSLNTYDMIFLDHDLSDTTNGVDIAISMVELGLQKETPIIIHSCNQFDAPKIKEILKDSHNVIEIPFNKFSGSKYWLYGDKIDDDNITINNGSNCCSAK